MKNIIAACILSAALIVAALVVSSSLTDVARSIQMHPEPTYSSTPFPNSMTVHVDNPGQTGFKVDTHSQDGPGQGGK